MSIVKTSSVFCDVGGPSCVGWIGEYTTANGGTVAARNEATRAGWHARPGGVDVCPGCVYTKPVCTECRGSVGFYGRHGWAHTVTADGCSVAGAPVPMESSDGT